MTKAFNKFGIDIFILMIISSMITIACTIRTPSTETPPPVDPTDSVGIEKSFFEDKTTVTVNGQTKEAYTSKTFLCGWAPISESTQIASAYLTHATIMTTHCNMEFEITEKALIGKLVNPTYPDGSNPAHRNRWKDAIYIPIKSHYYYEKAKDSYGRDTNEYIKNSSRSHYSARPLMDLAFDGLSIQSWDLATSLSSRTGSITKVDDIEWDKKNGFLGFTATVQDPSFGSEIGARIRFNFKAFQHNKNFKVTPYDPQNAKFLNALHVVGEKIEGVNQIWSAAKWDLSQTTDVYMYGFPKAYEPMAEETIAEWNKVFAKIDPTKRNPPAFRLNKKPMRYAFDLRYPMMVWVEDKEISEVAPLGIGMAAADVRNGQILWGQITLYGGYLEAYVKGYLESASSGSNSSFASKKSYQTAQEGLSLTPRAFETYFNYSGLIPYSSTLSEMPVSSLNLNLTSSTAQKLLGQYFISPTTRKLEAKAPAEPQENPQENPLNIEANRALLQKLSANFVYSYRQVAEDLRLQTTKASRLINKELLGFPKAPTLAESQSIFGRQLDASTTSEKLRLINYKQAAYLDKITSGVVHDLDRRIIDVAPMMAEAISQTKVGYDDGLKVIVKGLILHEFGHFLGLGHQFKENILPAKGSVPDKYVKKLTEDANHGMTNMTSVMGYSHPTTELLTPYSQFIPGPQDELTLRYLYNQEYPTFAPNSDATDFTFEKLPASGRIPNANPKNTKFKTSYFPQCNDFQASFSDDPYCNRFDRGYNADTIVSSYIDDLNINKVSRLHAFTEARGQNPDSAEGKLWYSSMQTLGRIRIFYDYMRQKYANELRTVLHSKRDLDEFSRVCRDELPGSENLQSLFKKNQELKELCRVNYHAVIEITNLLNTPGPDRTRMNWDNAVATSNIRGGDATPDNSSIFGTYTSLSVMPIKLSALNILTTPYPYTLLGGWMFPIPRFSGQDGLFSYSTLYSREFTAAIASALEKNLNIYPSKGEQVSIGLPILSLGYFLSQQEMGNDAIRLPKDFIDNLRSQTQFRVSLKAILIELQNRGDATRATQLVGTLFDPYTNKETALNQVFILPGGKIIARGQNRTFVYPISKQPTFLSNKSAYLWAYAIEYDKAYDDILASHSAKTKLEELNKAALDNCIRGDNDGLESFFSSQEPQFKGFFVMDGIATDQAKQIKFLESVNDNFQDFYRIRKSGNGNGPTAERCEKALNGVGAIVSAAAVLNGYWLPELLDQLETK